MRLQRLGPGGGVGGLGKGKTCDRDGRARARRLRSVSVRGEDGGSGRGRGRGKGPEVGSSQTGRRETGPRAKVMSQESWDQVPQGQLGPGQCPV